MTPSPRPTEVAQRARERAADRRRGIERRLGLPDAGAEDEQSRGPGDAEEDSRPRLVEIAPVPPDFTKPVRAAVLTVFSLVVLLFVWGLHSGVFTSVERMQAWVDSFGLLGPVVYVAAQAAQVVVPVIPGGVGIVAGPLLFGFWEGSLWNYVAVVIGSLIDFQIGRHVGLPAVRSVFPGPVVDKYLSWTRHPDFAKWFAVAIFLPVAPDDLLCYLAGTTGMKFRWFTWIILLGKPWAVLIYSWLVVNVGGSLAGLLGWG